MTAPPIICAALGLAITLFLVPLVLQWVPRGPQSRADWHHSPGNLVPRFGGGLLVVAFIVVELFIRASQPLSEVPGRNALVLGCLAMFVLGLWDDVNALGPVRKLMAQTLIAAFVWADGIRLETWPLPFGQGTVHLGMWGPLATIIWLVTLTNLVNLTDGIDGLAGNICLMSMILMACLAHPGGTLELWAVGMAGALLGFLWHNFPPARIYLGDGGAYFLGFQIGLFSMINAQQGEVPIALVAPLFVLALPIIDAVVTLLRRAVRGLPLLRPDRKHIHHRLIAGKASRRKVMLRVYAVNLLLLLLGLAAVWSQGALLPLLLILAVVLIAACASVCEFSRRWLFVHEVLRGSGALRREVQYALTLVRWLELESCRRPGPEELWANFVFAAEKLGFASIKLKLPDEQLVWQKHEPINGSSVLRQEYLWGRLGSLEFAGPSCPLGPQRGFVACGRRTDCDVRGHGCLADPRLFEIVSDLLAEAWNAAAAQCNPQLFSSKLNRRLSNLAPSGILKKWLPRFGTSKPFGAEFTRQ